MKKKHIYIALTILGSLLIIGLAFNSALDYYDKKERAEEYKNKIKRLNSINDRRPKKEKKEYKVTEIFPVIRKEKVTDNIEVTVKRINNLNREHYNPIALLMNNGNVLIGGNGLEVFNSENNTFDLILDNIYIKTMFEYKPNQYLINGKYIYNSITNKLSDLPAKEYQLREEKETKIENKLFGEDVLKRPNRDIWSYGFISPSTKLYVKTDKKEVNYGCEGFYLLDYKNLELSKYIKFKQKREDFNTLVLEDKQILFIGGVIGTKEPLSSTFQAINISKVILSVELYDPITKKISVIGKMLEGSAKSAELSDKRILMTGVPSNNNEECSAEIFDINTKQNTKVKNTFLCNNGIRNSEFSSFSYRYPYFYREINYLGNRIALLTGEYLSLYDTNSNMFYALDHLAMPRDFHSAVTLKNGRVLILGGNLEEYKEAKMGQLMFYQKHCHLGYQTSENTKPKSVCEDISKSAEIIEVKVKK